MVKLITHADLSSCEEVEVIGAAFESKFFHAGWVGKEALQVVNERVYVALLHLVLFIPPSPTLPYLTDALLQFVELLIFDPSNPFMNSLFFSSFIPLTLKASNFLSLFFYSHS